MAGWESPLEKELDPRESGQLVNTGLVKEAIRRKGLAVSERSLDYYLNNLESRGLIRLKKIRKRGLTRDIVLNIDLNL